MTLLFLQNHQRPDFLGIFSFTQASSVAWRSNNHVNPTHTPTVYSAFTTFQSTVGTLENINLTVHSMAETHKLNERYSNMRAIPHMLWVLELTLGRF